MRAPRPRPARTLLALGLAGIAVAATGACSVSRDSSSPSSADASDGPSPTATSTVTVTPVATPSTSPGDGTASAGGSASPSTTTSSSSAPTTPGPLLAAAELPTTPGTSPWTQQRSGPAGTAPFGLCQKVDLLSIGATTDVERSFDRDRDTAAQQVARFPDARTASRADQVLQSWRGDCSTRVRASAVRISPLRTVAVPNGSAWQYTLTYEVGGDVHAHVLGVVRRGTTLSLVRLDLSGQADDSAPIPADLMAPVLATASERLG